MKLFYRITRSKDQCIGGERYGHAYVSVYELDKDYPRSSPDSMFDLTWQCSHDLPGWYGFHLELKTHTYHYSSEKQLKSALKFTQRLNAARINHDNPKLVLQFMTDTLGIERRVYDPREGTYLLPSEVKPKEFQRWMAWADGECKAAVLAKDEEDASRMLMKDFADRIADGDGWGSSARGLEKWIAAGKPVKLDNNPRYPEIETLDELLKPMKEPEPAPKEEQKEEVVA